MWAPGIWGRKLGLKVGGSMLKSGIGSWWEAGLKSVVGMKGVMFCWLAKSAGFWKFGFRFGFKFGFKLGFKFGLKFGYMLLKSCGVRSACWGIVNG